MTAQSASRRFENDGAEHPFAEDFESVWHRRAPDDAWIVSPGQPNAQAVCGRAIRSVHVSSFDPRLLHEFGSDGERVCEECFDESDDAARRADG